MSSKKLYDFSLLLTFHFIFCIFLFYSKTRRSSESNSHPSQSRSHCINMEKTITRKNRWIHCCILSQEKPRYVCFHLFVCLFVYLPVIHSRSHFDLKWSSEKIQWLKYDCINLNPSDSVSICGSSLHFV